MAEQFEKIEAVYNPKNLETLRDEVKPFIGRTFTFQYGWLMDEDDPFPGVWALYAYGTNVPLVHWVPEFDLDIIEGSG